MVAAYNKATIPGGRWNALLITAWRAFAPKRRSENTATVNLRHVVHDYSFVER